MKPALLRWFYSFLIASHGRLYDLGCCREDSHGTRFSCRAIQGIFAGGYSDFSTPQLLINKLNERVERVY